MVLWIFVAYKPCSDSARETSLQKTRTSPGQLQARSHQRSIPAVSDPAPTALPNEDPAEAQRSQETFHF